MPVKNSFLYLVAIMDWAMCKVLSWRVSNTMHADFCVEALNEAIAKYGPPEIMNTDSHMIVTSSRMACAGQQDIGISGGKVLSSRSRRSSSRAAALLRLAAITIGRSDTALGAFYRRLAARASKAKAVTATARKIAALFYNTLRHGMIYKGPGASHYMERYRNRVQGNLKRRAKSFGYDLHELPADVDMAAS